MVSAHNSTQYIVKVSGNIWTICVLSGWASGWSCLSRRSWSSLLLSTADTHGFSRVLLIFIKSLINSVTIQSIQRTGLPPWCKIKITVPWMYFSLLWSEFWTLHNNIYFWGDIAAGCYCVSNDNRVGKWPPGKRSCLCSVSKTTGFSATKIHSTQACGFYE